jgi:tetratricopeptide (TPR) repeat protein
MRKTDMKDRFKVTCLSLLLLTAPLTAWTTESIGPASEAVLQQLREQEGAEPSAEDLVGALNRRTVRIYQDGNYALAETVAREAMVLGERVLGKDHPQTLLSVNNLAALYQAQGRYGEAEPLYVRALQTSERVLGKDHPDTLTTHLNLVVVLINTQHRDKALRELRRMDERLRRFVGAQLTTTLQERVRRRWLVSESHFQDVVFSLALQHPQPDILRLAADVLLRWKRLAGEAEAQTARLARTNRDPRVVKTAGELSRWRAILSRLVNLPEPDKDAIAAARAQVERLDVALARLSREFQGYLAGRAVEWEQVQSALPRGAALLSLRAFHPVDFATGDLGEPHWLALLIPADPGDGPEIVLKDLGPVAPTVAAHKALQETGSAEAARALYRLLFGALDAQLAEYERLYIAPDGKLDLVAFARLVVPGGQYWAERQALHQVRVGRDLAQQGSGPAAGGMVVVGGVDYSEGVYGLVRAFRIAGAHNVLMTLWPLNDRLAADFMKDFYAKWFEDPKRHPAEALQETRLAWIRSKDPKRSDPTYWAPYVLIEGR